MVLVAVAAAAEVSRFGLLVLHLTWEWQRSLATETECQWWHIPEPSVRHRNQQQQKTIPAEAAEEEVDATGSFDSEFAVAVR